MLLLLPFLHRSCTLKGFLLTKKHPEKQAVYLTLHIAVSVISTIRILLATVTMSAKLRCI